MMKGTICSVERKGGNAAVRPDGGGRMVILRGSAGKPFFFGQRVLYERLWPLMNADLAQRYRLRARDATKK